MVDKEGREELRKNLPYVRIIWGWTQSDLAEDLDVTRTTIANIENLENYMSTVQYYAIKYWEDGLIDPSRKRYVLMYVLQSKFVNESTKEDLKKRIDDIVKKQGWKKKKTQLSEKVVSELVPFYEKMITNLERSA